MSISQLSFTISDFTPFPLLPDFQSWKQNVTYNFSFQPALGLFYCLQHNLPYFIEHRVQSASLPLFQGSSRSCDAFSKVTCDAPFMLYAQTGDTIHFLGESKKQSHNLWSISFYKDKVIVTPEKLMGAIPCNPTTYTQFFVKGLHNSKSQPTNISIECITFIHSEVISNTSNHLSCDLPNVNKQIFIKDKAIQFVKHA